MGCLRLWGDIYPAQRNNINSLTSAYNAGILVARSWDWHVRNALEAGKRLMTDQEFTQFAAGSPEKTNIIGSTDPLVTSIPLDTAGVSILSGIGCAMMTGCKNQWIDANAVKQIAGIIDTQVSGGGASFGVASCYFAVNYTGSGGHKVYLGMGDDGQFFLCSETGGDSFKNCNDAGHQIAVKDGAGLSFQVYFDDDASPINERFLQADYPADIYIPITRAGWGFLKIKYDPQASTKGVALYFKDTDNSFYASHSSPVENQYLTVISVSALLVTCTPSAPSFSWLNIDDHGSIYQQSCVKMVAGGKHDDADKSGSCCRSQAQDRTAKLSSIGARYCCEPAVVRAIA